MMNVETAAGRRAATALIWVGVAASAWYWFSTATLNVAPPAQPAGAMVKAAAGVQVAELARFLGGMQQAGPPAERGADQRFALVGVIANATGEGAALIAVDGRAAQPFSVGAELAPGYVLKAVGPREASIAERADGPVLAVLPMPVTGSASPPPSAAPGVQGMPAAAAPPPATSGDAPPAFLPPGTPATIRSGAPEYQLTAPEPPAPSSTPTQRGSQRN